MFLLILCDIYLFSGNLVRNYIKSAIMSFRLKPESSIIKYFLDSGSSPGNDKMLSKLF
jgi:hypothetical protein